MTPTGKRRGQHAIEEEDEHADRLDEADEELLELVDEGSLTASWQAARGAGKGEQEALEHVSVADAQHAMTTPLHQSCQEYSALRRADYMPSTTSLWPTPAAMKCNQTSAHDACTCVSCMAGDVHHQPDILTGFSLLL